MIKLQKSALILGATVLIAGAATLSVRHYDQYKTKQDAVVAQAQAREAAEDKELVALLADVQLLVKTANDNRVACEKGLASYNLLTSFQRSKAAMPVCGAVVVR